MASWKSTQVRRVTREQLGIAMCSTRGRPAGSHCPDLCSNGMGEVGEEELGGLA